MKQRQRLLQQRLAKARQSFNNLVAALIKASTSASDLVKPEPEVDHRLPEIRTPRFTLNLDSREALQHFGLPPRVLQRERLFQMSQSTLQRLTRSLQVEFVMPRREAALLWVLPRRTGSFARVGCQLQPPERTLFLFIPLGKPLLSFDSSSVLLALSPPADSKPIVLEPLEKKRFPEALPGLGLPSAVPVARRPSADQKAPIAKPLKSVSPDPVADNPPGSEQLSSDDRTGRVARKAIPKVYYQRDYKLPRAGQPFRRASGFIRKPFRPGQKRSFRQEFSGVKKRLPCLGHSANSHPRIRGGSPAARASLSGRKLELIGKEHLKGFHRRSIGGRAGQRRFRWKPEVISTVHYRKWIDYDLPPPSPRVRGIYIGLGASPCSGQIWHNIYRRIVKQRPTNVALGDAAIASGAPFCNDCVAATQLISREMPIMAVTGETLIEAMSSTWSRMPQGYYYRRCPPTCLGAHLPLPITHQFTL